MKYLLTSVFLAATVLLSATDKKTIPAPEKKQETVPVTRKIAEQSRKTFRKLKHNTLRTLDFSGSYTVRTSIESVQADRLEKIKAAGTFMINHFAGKKVALLLLGPVDSADNKNYVEIFQKIVSDKVQIILISVDAGKDPLPFPDEEPGVTALNDALLKSIAKGADALVNLAGLPSRNSHCSKLLFWQWSENDPRVYLVDAPDTLLLKPAMFPCPIAAVAVPRLLTEDQRAEATDFHTRYIELTEKNLKTSGLFPNK